MADRIYQWAGWVMVCMLAAPAMAANVSIAAVVGDDIISTTDVAERRDLIMATSGIPNTVENQQKLNLRITQSLIDETLQLQEARRQSLSVDEEQIAAAIAEMSTGGQNSENLLTFIEKNKLSKRSLENQVRAQLAWNKVVQRKLRRNVTISQDEIARAQATEAAAPGEVELRLAGFDIAIPSPDKEKQASAQADEVVLQLKSGEDSTAIASRLIRSPGVQFKPPSWIPESSLPTPLQQALRNLKPGESTPALRNATSFTIVQLLDRKTAPKLAETTEYAVKQIAIDVPKKRDKASLAKLREAASTLRTNPGSCMSEAIPKVAVPATVKFARVKLGAMSPQQRQIVGHMEVGDVSEPIPGPDAVRLVMLCEKIEPAASSLPDRDRVRQQLFSEKLELEAQKHMRNLRRDAFIEIKDMQ